MTNILESGRHSTRQLKPISSRLLADLVYEVIFTHGYKNVNLHFFISEYEGNNNKLKNTFL